MELTRYKCFVGSSRGFLLSTTEKPLEIKYLKPEFVSEITSAIFDKEQKNIFVGYQNGLVHIYDSLENSYIDTISDLNGKGSIVGLGTVDEVLIAGKSDGTINIWNGNKNKYFDINLSDNGTLNSAVLNIGRRSLGTGGEYNDFKLWDVETQQCIFKAKSLGHDNLNLPIPTSVRGITFFPEDLHLSCCCTKEGHVLVYDDRQQRRPIIKFIETKASYTAITSTYRDRQCLVGTTRGYMQLLDMKTGKCMKTFTSFTGSVTDIKCDSLEPYVFSTSLDRHLRVHNLETKELLHKVYMKVNLTSLLIKPIVKQEDDITEEELINTNSESINSKDVDEVDEEYESMFDKMEVIGNKTKKKNKKSLEVLKNPMAVVEIKKKKKKKTSMQLVNPMVDTETKKKNNSKDNLELVNSMADTETKIKNKSTRSLEVPNPIVDNETKKKNKSKSKRSLEVINPMAAKKKKSKNEHIT